MQTSELTAVVSAITKGALAKDSPLSVHEFQAIRDAVAIINRKWAIELVAEARQGFKQQVEALAAWIM